MATVSPPGYSRLFATGLFLSTEGTPTAGDSRSTTPTPITTAPQTPAFEFPPASTYTGSAIISIPSFTSTAAAATARRPKLAALRTLSSRTSNGPISSGPPSASASAPSSPRVLRRRRSSVTLSHNPMAGIKSPTRAAGMSGRIMQALGNVSPGKERRTCSLDIVGESPRTRRIPSARKPPPTTPLPQPPLLNIPNQLLPPLPTHNLPMLTLNTSFPSPMSLSPALTPSPNILPAPTPLSGIHKFSLANVNKRPGRSPLVPVADMNLGYFDVPVVRDSSPVLPENEMDME